MQSSSLKEVLALLNHRVEEVQQGAAQELSNRCTQSTSYNRQRWYVNLERIQIKKYQLAPNNACAFVIAHGIKQVVELLSSTSQNFFLNLNYTFHIDL